MEVYSFLSFFNRTNSLLVTERLCRASGVWFYVDGVLDTPHVDSTLKKGMLGAVKKDGKGVSRKQSMHQKIFGGGDKHKVGGLMLLFLLVFAVCYNYFNEE